MTESAPGRRDFARLTAWRAGGSLGAGHWAECRIRSQTVPSATCGSEATVWIAVLVKHSRCPTMPSRSVPNPVAAIIHRGATDVPSARITRSDSTALTAPTTSSARPARRRAARRPASGSDLVFPRSPSARATAARSRSPTDHPRSGWYMRAISGSTMRAGPARTAPGRYPTESVPWPASPGAAACVPQARPSRAVVNERDRDVGGRIACADNEDVAAPIGPSVGEVPGVDDARR